MEYVSKEKLYDELTEIVADVDADAVMKRLPTIDIVRCGECKNAHRSAQGWYCKAWGAFQGNGAEGFCNYGERRTE